MTRVNAIRIPGLATGMDTDTVVKQMLVGEQNKIDKVKQKEQIVKWQQEIYRDVMKDLKNINDKYFSVTSKDSIISSKAWNTLSVQSSNSSVMSATSSAGADNIHYKFEVNKIAEPAKVVSSNNKIEKSKKLSELGAKIGESFKISVGKDDKGNTLYSNPITIEGKDTIEDLVDKINSNGNGKIKASYSKMTGSFSIESLDTGSDSNIEIISEDGSKSNSLAFLGLKTKKYQLNTDGSFVLDSKNEIAFDMVEFSGITSGSNSYIKVSGDDGFSKVINEQKNNFSIDGIDYSIYNKGTSEITSKKDTTKALENMKGFVQDYNKIMDKMYSLITEKSKKDYKPLTEEQKKDMSEEEVKKWEANAKKGILRNDSEMRRFINDMQNAVFGDNIKVLSEMGVTSPEDYNKKGQISLNEDKFTKALEYNSDKVYKLFAKDKSSIMGKMNNVLNKNIGGSSSIFARKAGMERTSSVVKNFYSEQIKRQEDMIKSLQRKMDNKENALYKKFADLEASMNKLNSQMSYFMQA